MIQIIMNNIKNKININKNKFKTNSLVHHKMKSLTAQYMITIINKI